MLVAIRIVVSARGGSVRSSEVAEGVNVKTVLTFGQAGYFTRDLNVTFFLLKLDRARDIVSFGSSQNANQHKHVVHGNSLFSRWNKALTLKSTLPRMAANTRIRE